MVARHAPLVVLERVLMLAAMPQQTQSVKRVMEVSCIVTLLTAAAAKAARTANSRQTMSIAECVPPVLREKGS